MALLIGGVIVGLGVVIWRWSRAAPEPQHVSERWLRQHIYADGKSFPRTVTHD